MEFSWTTFALEIINFLVLVWILKRFLYKPVTNTLAQRKAAIDASVEQARLLQATAEELNRRYESRMADWEAERGRARAQLSDQIAAERAHLLAELHKSIEAEREKNQALEQRRAAELRQKLAQDARAEATAFAAQLLARLAGPALEERVSQIAVEDLPQLPQDQIAALRQACLDGAGPVRVTSVYPLSAETRAKLAAALSTVAGRPVPCEFGQNDELISGLRLSVGPWVLRCSLADDLVFFAQSGGRAPRLESQ